MHDRGWSEAALARAGKDRFQPGYALWNNKGGVGKSYLKFQIASEYPRTHPQEKVLVIDLCPQDNASSMLLGGIIQGEQNLDNIALTTASRRRTIAGYMEERILSPYMSPNVGASELILVVGDEELEIQASRVANATSPGPADA